MVIAFACVNGSDSHVSSSRAHAISAADLQMNKTIDAHLSIDDTIVDLLKHPAFAGFGRLILPWDDPRWGTNCELKRSDRGR